MSYSLEAFTYQDFNGLNPGTVFADEDGRWYMTARLAGRDENLALRLDSNDQGAGLGSLVANVRERVFAVLPPYSISIRVDDLFDLRKSSDGPFSGTILLASPPAIYAVGHERKLIGLNGHEIDEDTVHRRRARYLQWSVWLVDPQGKTVGNGPLVSVDATEDYA